MSIVMVQGKPDEVLDEVFRRYGSNKNVSEAVGHLREMLSLIERPERVLVDMSLVRGLDYYTGPILEVVLSKPKIGSVAGGGRYDELIGLFLGEKIPATGVSIGIERIIDAGLELGIYNLTQRTVTRVQVIVLDREVYSYAWRAAGILRREGIPARIDLGRTSNRVQRRKAQRLGIPVLVFIGRREAERGEATVYSAQCGMRRTVPLSSLVRTVVEALECGGGS